MKRTKKEEPKKAMLKCFDCGTSYDVNQGGLSKIECAKCLSTNTDIVIKTV